MDHLFNINVFSTQKHSVGMQPHRSKRRSRELLQLHHFSPAERIFGFAELDSGIFREEFRADRARILAVTVGEFLAGDRIHNHLDRGNHGGGTAFVDVFLFLRIKVDGAGVAELLRFGEEKQAGSIVTADLHRTRTLRSGAVEVAADHHIDRLETILEVRTHRSHEHQQQVFVGGLHAHLEKKRKI